MLARLRRDYLSFAGRIPRLVYWRRSLASAIVSGLLVAAGWLAQPYSHPAFLILSSIAFVISALTLASLSVRRFQDHGRNGWLGLGVLVAAAAIAYGGDFGLAPTYAAVLGGAVSLALFVYLGFVRGSRRTNRYGPDPLA